MENYKRGKQLFKEDLLKMHNKKVIVSHLDDDEEVDIVKIKYATRYSGFKDVLLDSSRSYYEINDNNMKVYEYIDVGEDKEIEDKEYTTLEVIKTLMDNPKIYFKSKKMISDIEIVFIGNVDNDIKLARNIEELNTFKSEYLPMYEVYLNQKWIKVEAKKQFLTFEEARKTGKKFRYKGWIYKDVKAVFRMLLCATDSSEVNMLMDEKVWEVEE